MPPPVKQNPYDTERLGYFGQLGHGANAQIRYLQTAITREELGHLTLIQNIPGSERWDVRDLFQRDVDEERVEKQIIPYLKGERSVKFFNPLTLLLLPMEEGGDAPVPELAVAETSSIVQDKEKYSTFERPGHFRFMLHSEPAYSKLSWNSSRTKVVAIDGQHRLSALKRWSNEPGGAKDLSDWTIPVVILGVFKASQKATAPGLLEVVRRTFININSEAKEVNPSRKILLNDESVNAVCTQELINAAHRNDCRQAAKRDRKKVPLIFFDWRGSMKDNKLDRGPAAIKSIQEIHSWFENFLLGVDGSTDQELALSLEDLVPKLTTFAKEKTLSHDDAKKIRGKFTESMLPGVEHLLENFTPYKDYIAACRAIEAELVEKSDTAKHAFSKIRFGSHQADKNVWDAVENSYLDLVLRFGELKTETFEELIDLDIGMRAVMFAFGYGKVDFDADREDTSSWKEYAEWFTKAVSQVYAEGWFKSFSDQEKKKKEFLIHVCFDPSGSIINYKEDHQRQALGALVAVLVLVAGEDELGTEAVSSAADSYIENLKVSLRNGFRKVFRAKLDEEGFKGTKKQIREQVKVLTEQATEKRVKALRKYLELE